MHWAWMPAKRGLLAWALKRGARNLSGGSSGLQMMPSCMRRWDGSSLSSRKTAALRMPGTVRLPQSAAFRTCMQSRGGRKSIQIFTLTRRKLQPQNRRRCILKWGPVINDHPGQGCQALDVFRRGPNASLIVTYGMHSSKQQLCFYQCTSGVDAGECRDEISPAQGSGRGPPVSESAAGQLSTPRAAQPAGPSGAAGAPKGQQAVAGRLLPQGQ